MPILNCAAEMQPLVAEWRRDLHRHPELLYEVHRTAAKVAELLREFGCDEVVEGVGRTGVVGVIRGGSDGSGRVVALRADMDALPIHEESGAEWSSQTPGAMHACGHDGHTAMLLGAAKYLAETRRFDGTAVVVFQPAEEGGAGGAAMVEDGLMERFRIQEIYGMHNWPGRPAGSFAIRSGPFFAAADVFEIVVRGRGGHAAKPQIAVDPVVAAAQVVTALQSVVSRNVDPVGQAVVSVCALESSSRTHNVIPSSVRMQGTVRTLDPATRDLVERRLGEVARATAEAHGAEAQVSYERGYPVMVNLDEQTEFAAEVARAVAGECAESPLVMGGEDFAYMLEARPGAYILVGNGDTAPVHNPAYDFNDEAIPAGVSWWAGVVECRMPVA